MSLGLFNCRLIQPARDQLFFFAGCLAAPVPVRASSVQSPCDASCSAPTSGRARNASCVFPSQEGFVLVFRGSEAPVGCRRVHPTDSPTNSPEDPPILPAIEPFFHPVAVADFDVGPRPYSDAASDFSATNSVSKALGEHHEESLHPVCPGGGGKWAPSRLYRS